EIVGCLGQRRQKRRARRGRTVRRSARDGSQPCSCPGERPTFSWFPRGRPTNSSLALCEPRGEHAAEALGTADSLTRHPRVRDRDASGAGLAAGQLAVAASRDGGVECHVDRIELARGPFEDDEGPLRLTTKGCDPGAEQLARRPERGDGIAPPLARSPPGDGPDGVDRPTPAASYR